MYQTGWSRGGVPLREKPRKNTAKEVPLLAWSRLPELPPHVVRPIPKISYRRRHSIFTAEDAEDAEERQLQEPFQKLLQ